MSKVILEETVKNYIQKKQEKSEAKIALLLEYYDPCSICTGAVATWKIHLVSVRDQESLEKKHECLKEEGIEIWVPNHLEKNARIQIAYKKHFWEREGKLQVSLSYEGA